jgi:hypothetical protein
MMKSVCAVLFVLISGFIVSCTNVPGETPISKDPTISSNLVTVSIPDAKEISDAVLLLQQYSDTANRAWTDLNQANAEKVTFISQLVAEFSRTKGITSMNDFDNLKQLLQETKKNTLTLNSQYNNASVHHYDNLNDSLTTKTLRMYSRLKSARKSKPVMAALVNKIQKAEEEVTLKKGLYNEAAKKYNDFFWEKRTFVLQARGELPARPVRACFRNKA